MTQLLKAAWREDDGVLSFEWVLLVTLLTIGIVSGLAAARDAIIDELSDVAEAAISIDQSYSLDAFVLMGDTFTITVFGSDFTDDTAADLAAFEDCDRASTPLGQGPEFD